MRPRLDAGPFLWGARTDITVFGASFALPLLLVLLARASGTPNRELPEWGFLAFVVAVDVAHVYATLFRTYFDGQELRRHRLRYLGLPALAFALGAWAWASSPLTFFRLLAYLAVVHFVRQQAGWVALYRARAGDRRLRTRLIDGAAIYAATLYPLLVWHAAPAARRFAWFMPGDFVELSQLARVLPLAEACWAAALVLFFAEQVWLAWRQRRFALGKTLVVAGSALTWYVGVVATNGDFEFTVTNVLPHGVPYLALLWFYARSRAAEAPRALGSRLLAGGLVAFLAVVLLAALLEEALWDRLVWHDHGALFGEGAALSPLLLNLVAPLLVVPQAVHYALDGVLWRRADTRERPAQRRALGFETRAAAALVCLALLVGCARTPAPLAAPPAAPAATPAPVTTPVPTVTPMPAPAPAPAAASRRRYLLKHDADVTVAEPAPHAGVGRTTAYRYFDELTDAGLIFRKRALHPGAANGVNVLKHDEVYYVLSGKGELEVDGDLLPLTPGTAVFMYLGAKIILRQQGTEDLVIIIAYPPAKPPG